LAALLARDGLCDVLLVPHLYDLDAAGPSVAALRELSGDLVVLAWLYPRATHWILDRHGVRGRRGQTRLDEDENAAAEDGQAEAGKGSGRVSATTELPDRTIYCFDLRRHESPQPYLEAIQEIVQGGVGTPAESRQSAPPKPEAPASGGPRLPLAGASGFRVEAAPGAGSQIPLLRRIDEQVRRCWYPVIDFSRCTNCMECIDFCLFGVYGVDEAENLLVELPDNCRKGCPACSRVCPENAIMFPQHKTPAIAGGMREPGGLKLDLSTLFGAAEILLNERAIAARERDEYLLIAGQRPAGPTDAVSAPQANEPAEPRDELDALIDRLDAMEL
jgi:hypothetical protein